MHKRVTFRHMEPVADLENHAQVALDAVIEALSSERTPIYIDLVLSPGRPHAHHQVELLVKSPNYDLICKEEGPHMYQLIDLACDIVCRKIREQKKRMINERRTGDSY